MNHRDTKESVLIRTGLYSSSIFEMEIWSLAKNLDYTDDDYKEKLEVFGHINCGLSRESVGLFPTKERALESLKMMYEDSFDDDRELYCAFIREKAMYCMMHPNAYIKEWTYVNGQLVDESLLRNYDEDENPFYGRPKEMIRFKRGDIVMIPGDGFDSHWGIVYGTPITAEYIKEVYDRIEPKTGVKCHELLNMDWSDDQYTIITNDKGSHEHILAHYVLPASHVPEYVRETLKKGL